jgi:hypothetical protein
MTVRQKCRPNSDHKPVIFPVMFTVVYLCSNRGQVAGSQVIRVHYPEWLLYFFLITAVTGSIIEAAAQGLPISLRALRKTSRNIFSVSLPVWVFCWEG